MRAQKHAIKQQNFDVVLHCNIRPKHELPPLVCSVNAMIYQPQAARHLWQPQVHLV